MDCIIANGPITAIMSFTVTLVLRKRDVARDRAVASTWLRLIRQALMSRMPQIEPLPVDQSIQAPTD